ncbi:TetR/AcrR family transcriptional regulator [Kribbella kalugense]|uniref:TetR family transcriptional regulator n=1 Tax=Kribbella kalugense TaxID=2512221 RepID=A0A4R7ZG17_9ACTN|nr:TetR/AcrR family transcriptional regulator [Kribbella kalugense]TDW15251.1 TetR family transcriptional regulator [Kribbella kalugense]
MRNTLTVEQIVTAAIEQLDSEGLDGLNMRALGQRLGSAPTAIYWHIKTKDELVQLAADAAWAEVGLPDLDAMDWRAAATVMATGLRSMLLRHPWYAQAFGSHLLAGRSKFEYDDHSLANYERAGFAPADADCAAGTVMLFVIGSALGAAAQVSLNRRLSRGGQDAERTMKEFMTAARSQASQFRHLRARMGTTAAAEYAAEPDNTFEFGLQSILDGFAARLAR